MWEAGRGPPSAGRAVRSEFITGQCGRLQSNSVDSTNVGGRSGRGQRRGGHGNRPACRQGGRRWAARVTGRALALPHRPPGGSRVSAKTNGWGASWWNERNAAGCAAQVRTEATRLFPRPGRGAQGCGEQGRVCGVSRASFCRVWCRRTGQARTSRSLCHSHSKSQSLSLRLRRGPRTSTPPAPAGNRTFWSVSYFDS